MSMVVEKPWRSLAKAISYRITGTLATMIVSLVVTGNLKAALSIGLVEAVCKVFIFYGHERLWNRLNIGREVKPDPEYQI